MAVFLPVISSLNLALNSSRPALLDLKITNWGLFAAHLPGVTQSLIQSIENEFPSSEQRLERLFKCWLKICPHASWLDVLIALLEAKENDIYCNLLGKVTSKRSWVASRSQEDVVASIDDLCKRFEVILKEMKDALTISDTPLEKIVNEVEQFLEMEKGELSHHVFNIDELFNELQPYCNYLNFELIQFLLQFLKGTAATTQSTISSVMEYAKNLLLLLQSAKLSFVVSAMPAPASSKRKTTTSVKFKLSSAWQNCSVHILLKTLEYSLNVKGIYFCHIYLYINRSILCLKVFFPKSCEQQLRTLLVSNQQRLLQLGIMKCDETITSHTSELDLIRFKASCFKAVQEKDTIALIIMLFCRLVSADCTNESKETPLMISAREGHEDIVRTLLLAGADTSIVNIDDYTAQMIASEHHHKIAFIFNQHAVRLKRMSRSTNKEKAITDGNELFDSLAPKKQEVYQDLSIDDSSEKKSLTSGQSMSLEPPISDVGPLESVKQRTIIEESKEIEEIASSSDFVQQNEPKEPKEPSQLPLAVKQEDTVKTGKKSWEYKTLKKNLPEISDAIAGRITDVALSLFSKNVLPENVYHDACNTSIRSSDRVASLVNEVLRALSSNPNREKIFDNFCESLDTLEIDTTMLKRHDDTGTKTRGSSTVGSLEQSTSQELEHNAFRFDKDQERKTKSMIESIHKEFTNLAAEVRKSFLKRVKSDDLKFDEELQAISELTAIPVEQLIKKGPESLFDQIKFKDEYDAFNCDVIGYIIEEILNDKTLKEKFTKHKSSIAKFQELASIKDIIKHVNKVIPPAVKPADSCTVLIKVHEVWGNKTKEILKLFLSHCIGHNISSHIKISISSICVEFFIPVAKSQDIIDRVKSKRFDLYQLGIYYMMIDETKIIDKADSINLEEALLQFAQDGKQFEVSMALELGADINWQNEFGMTALVIATEEGHTEVVKELLREGADAELSDDAGQTALDVATKKNESELIAILSERAIGAISRREPSIITKDEDKEEKKQEKKWKPRKEEKKKEKREEKKEEKEKKEEIKGPEPISLSDPSEEHCRRIINEAKNHEDITFSSNKVDIVRMFLLLLKDQKLKRLVIQDTNLTTNCIISLSGLITTNVTLEELELRNCVEKNYDESVFDDKLAEELCTSLKRNTTLKKLSLRSMKLSEEAIYNFMDMMYDNKLICLKLDSNHRDICKENTYFMDEEISKRIEFIKI